MAKLSQKSCFVVACLALGSLATPVLAGAGGWEARVSGVASKAWLDQRYSLTINDHALRDVLREFAAAAGVPVRISDVVSGRVTERFDSVTGYRFLEALAQGYGFDWRFDGRRLHITAENEQVSRLLNLGGVPLSDLEEAMRSLGVWAPQFPITTQNERLAFVSGPPDYVALLEVTLADLVADREEREAALLVEHAARKAEAERQAEILANARREQAERRIQLLEEARAAREARRVAREEALRRAARLRALRDASGPTVIRGGAKGG